jgi:hypothetical protein
VGFAAFAADFGVYLDQRRAGDLRRSAAGHARRLANSLRDEVVLALRDGQWDHPELGRRRLAGLTGGGAWVSARSRSKAAVTEQGGCHGAQR